MTETGFPITNPYRPVDQRFARHIGHPWPGAKAALLDLDDNKTLISDQDPLPMPDFQGELLVQTPAMFDRYLNRPDATSETFLIDQRG